jgi:hypothetical protein
VLTADHFLIDGETFIDDYNVEIARWSNSRWCSTVPPLYGILTDHRIVLQPQTRKHYDPAIIPTTYIAGVTELNAERHGIMLHLKTGHRIGMFISGDPEHRMLLNLRALKVPRRAVRFEGDFNISTIQRIIEYIADAEVDPRTMQ